MLISFSTTDAGPVRRATIVVDGQSKYSDVDAVELRDVRPTIRICSEVAGNSFGGLGATGPYPGLK